VHTYVIAECGSCHDGDLKKAQRLIDYAKECGADAAKFQFWSSAERLADRRKAADYLDIYRRYQIPMEWLGTLRAHCYHVGIQFMCTTYLPEDIHVVEPYVERFKVASFEADDLPFVDAHAGFGKPIIRSCGMGAQPYQGRQQTLDLLCISSYPAPQDALNLHRLRGNRFVGLSDHTLSWLTGAVAVGAGACILEKHISLASTSADNPDVNHSLTADVDSRDGFRKYVWAVRQAEEMYGNPYITGDEDRIHECEMEMARYKVVRP